MDSTESSQHAASTDRVDAEVVAQAYRAADRTPADGDAWCLLNMVSSIDGAIAIDGVSGGLGNPSDKVVFRALRGLADVIVVASGTAVAEDYGPPVIDDETRDRRLAAGQAPEPTVAVFSRSLDFDTDTRLFGTDGFRPTVVTVDDAPADRRAAIGEVADVIEAGTGDVDLASASAVLAQRHGPVLLVEGGPTLNGLFAEADLFDEVCVSHSPMLVGGSSGRMLAGERQHDPRRFVADRTFTTGDMIFSRYLRDRSA